MVRSSQGRPLALVLEDDAGAAEALAFVLRDWGAEVISGAQGGAIADVLGPRLARARWIIADYDLGPGPNGVAQASLMRADAPDARVLVLTASVGPAVERDAARAGFEIMSKPAAADAILAWLEQY